MPNYVYYYVYSPATGYVRGLDNYCPSVGGGTHGIVRTGDVYPRDVSDPPLANTPLYFYGSNLIQSTRVSDLGLISCRDTTLPDKFRRAIRVQFYAQPNQVNQIGDIVYAHVQNPLNIGTANWSGTAIRTIQIGTIPDPQYCGCSCYTGAHSHMEVAPAPGVVSALLNTCDQPVTQKTTRVYQWKILV